MHISKPSLFIVCGPSGVGKTTVARHLAEKTGAVVLTTEAVILELFPLHSNKGQDRDFSTEELDAGYEEIYKRADAILASKKSVILDGVFRSEAQRQNAAALAKKHHVPFSLVVVTCPEHVVKERVTKRLKEGKQPGGFQNHLYLKRLFEDVKENHTIIDSSRDIQTQISAFLEL